MRLIIDNYYKEDLKPFIQDIVIPTIGQLLYSSLDRQHLERFDRYLSNKYDTKIDCKQIIKLALNNLIIYNHHDSYQITINPNTFINGINAKLYDICALINYGNLELAPYPIFDNTMDRLASFIPQLYRQYMFGG